MVLDIGAAHPSRDGDAMQHVYVWSYVFFRHQNVFHFDVQDDVCLGGLVVVLSNDDVSVVHTALEVLNLCKFLDCINMHKMCNV